MAAAQVTVVTAPMPFVTEVSRSGRPGPDTRDTLMPLPVNPRNVGQAIAVEVGHDPGIGIIVRKSGAGDRERATQGDLRTAKPGTGDGLIVVAPLALLN